MQLDEIRQDLRDAHDEAWRRIGRPGTWLTGPERVAIANETRVARDCPLCLSRKQALSPFGVEGEHSVAAGTALSPPLIELVHRVTTDPGRLSKQWHDGLAIEPTVYVEALAVAATTIGIDTFHRAVGLELRDLPVPQPGVPSRVMPKGPLDYTMAWIPTRKIMGAANVSRSISIVPSEVRGISALATAEYVPVVHLLDVAKNPGRAITRPQMEFVAARLSARNECFY